MMRLFLLSFLPACAPVLVQGDADLTADELDAVGAGELLIVGEPGSTEVTVVQGLGEDRAAVFGQVRATCLDCNDPTCTRSDRTLEVELAHLSGSVRAQLTRTLSAENFDDATVVRFRPTHGGTDVLQITGNLPTCGTFRFHFDVEDAPRTVFVTDPVYSGALGGVAGADTICQANADLSPTLDGTAEGVVWRAWLSASGTSPATAWASGGAWHLWDGTRVTSDLFASPVLEHAIYQGPDGESAGGRDVWTNTSETGLPLFTGNLACNEMTSASPADLAFYGLSDQTGTWTFANADTCDQGRALYCFEQ